MVIIIVTTIIILLLFAVIVFLLLLSLLIIVDTFFVPNNISPSMNTLFKIFKTNFFLKNHKNSLEALNLYLSNNHGLDNNFTIADQNWWPEKPKWGTGSWKKNCWVEIFHFLIETGKVFCFKSLRVNCLAIDQITPKYPMDFFDKACKKRSKTENVNIIIEFYIFEIV